MSGPVRIPLARAEGYARQFLRLIGDACVRVEVAGSIRRRLPQIGEVEVVVVPKILEQSTLFGDDLPPRDLLIEAIDRLVSRERVRPRTGERGRKVAWGTTRRAMLFRADGGQVVPFDLWWTTLDHWGVQLALRTGPAGLTYALTRRQGTVTPTGRAGMLPPDLRIMDGLEERVGDAWEPIPTPEEWDFLRHFYADPIPPEGRR